MVAAMMYDSIFITISNDHQIEWLFLVLQKYLNLI